MFQRHILPNSHIGGAAAIGVEAKATPLLRAIATPYILQQLGPDVRQQFNVCRNMYGWRDETFREPLSQELLKHFKVAVQNSSVRSGVTTLPDSVYVSRLSFS